MKPYRKEERSRMLDDFTTVLLCDESKFRHALLPRISPRIPALAEIGFRNSHATN